MIVATFAAISAGSASAHYVSAPAKQVKHGSDVLRFFKNHPHLAKTRPGKVAIRNHTWLLRIGRVALTPPAPRWGPWAFPDSCLRELSRRETAGTYSPTIWNYQGSGAYGIGQALPASKMAPFGADYMTNPWTQLRWMVAYVNGRYGGSCSALAFHNANGYY